MFSLLNHFYLHNNTSNDIDLNNPKTVVFFTLFKIAPYSKSYNTFDSINIMTITYNMPNFIYKSYLSNDSQKGKLIRSFYDYIMYNGDIIISDYNLLDYNTDFLYKEFDEEKLGDFTDFEEYDDDNDLYNNYVYSYFAKNYLIMVGKQVLKDDEKYEKYIQLSTATIVLDFKKIIYDLMTNLKGVLVNKYRKIMNSDESNAMVDVIYPLYDIVKKYMMEHLYLSVNYVYKEENKYVYDCEDYDDEDCEYYDDYYDDYENNLEENIRYVNNLHLLFVLDYVSKNVILKANLKYWIEEVFGEEESGFIMPADPLTLDITVFKVHNNIKILLNVIIEKKIDKLYKVSINKTEIKNADGRNIKYSIKEDDNFCLIKIYDEFEYVEKEFYADISSYFNNISTHMNRIFLFNKIK